MPVSRTRERKTPAQLRRRARRTQERQRRHLRFLSDIKKRPSRNGTHTIWTMTLQEEAAWDRWNAAHR